MVSKRQYDREFKLSIINELESKPISEVCREHNINQSLIFKWRKDYQTNPEKAFAGSGNIWKEEAKIAQYERLLGQAYAEIAFLKKTLEVLHQRRAEEKRLLKWFQNQDFQ